MTSYKDLDIKALAEHAVKNMKLAHSEEDAEEGGGTALGFVIDTNPGKNKADLSNMARSPDKVETTKAIPVETMKKKKKKKRVKIKKVKAQEELQWREELNFQDFVSYFPDNLKGQAASIYTPTYQLGDLGNQNKLRNQLIRDAEKKKEENVEAEVKTKTVSEEQKRAAERKELASMWGGDNELEEAAKESRKQKKTRLKEEREALRAGMKAPEMTSDRKRDLELLQMRRALDPKRFYKGNDTRGLPKYFQKGVVVENPVDFYSSRVPKKQRKKTIADELLSDTSFMQYTKRKFAEVVPEVQPKFKKAKKKKSTSAKA